MADLDARRTEVLGRAARTIQRQIRTHIARKQFLLLKKSAVDIQSLCRGKPLIYFCKMDIFKATSVPLKVV